MRKLSVSQASEVLGITKEAIYNRIRRKSLKSIDEKGVKYVLIEDDEATNEPQTKAKTTKTNTKKIVSENSSETSEERSEFIKFLLTQLEELKEQNRNLQDDKERLYAQKEQILIANKDEIAEIYKERDEKFRYFLQMLERPLLARQNGEYIRPIDVEFDEGHETAQSEEKAKFDSEVKDEIKVKKWLSLSEFLKSLNLKNKKIKKIQKLIIKNIGKSKFIKFKDGVIWVRNEKSIKQIVGEV
ncbi:DNA-binding protein [Campylobacter sp. RM16191]|uniref:DNA-binding protein n=1 Tax=Campylobacter sp. RM16191 TaxID=1705728 RepID=UPI0014752C50|nr:DNA-binding protein [Campylobacter sp. RM16191]